MRLKDHYFEDIDDRIVESYAVPAAMLSVLQGLDDAAAVELMGEMLAGVDRKDGQIADEADLMAAILSAHIHTGKESLSVAQLIEKVLRGDTDREHAAIHLAKCGLKISPMSFGGRPLDGVPEELAAGKALVIAYQIVTKHLLRATTGRTSRSIKS